jgi:hypothetical protein
MATTTRRRLRALLTMATGFYCLGTSTSPVNNTGIPRWGTGRRIDPGDYITDGNRAGEDEDGSEFPMSPADGRSTLWLLSRSA